MISSGIEFCTAKSGAPVLKSAGRFLASSIDPVAEGRKWATAVNFELAKRGAGTVFVLGAGSGYHVQALREQMPKIDLIALDPSHEVANAVMQIHPALLGQVHAVSDVDDLLAHVSLREKIFTDYRVFAYGATVQLHSEWAGGLDEFLLGRSPRAFQRHLEIRPELRAVLQAEKTAVANKELLSIKDLQSFFHPKAATKERGLWRVLEELIA